MGPRTENLPYGMIHLSTTGARALVFCSTHRRCPIIATTNNPYMPKGPVKDNDDLVNGKIRFPEVLLIDETGNSLGIKSRNEALRYAEDKNLDLLCVAPMAKPPVCKVLNYGKHRFEQQKKTREARKNQKVVEIKEARFTPQTDLHDLEVKAKAAIAWLQDGNKVKVTVRFRGRQMSHPEVGEETLNQFIELVQEFGTMEKKPIMEGRNMSTMVLPKPPVKA